MALARVVTFEGVGSERMEEMRSEMEGGEPPEGMPPAELIVLHDGEDKSLVLVIVDNEDDYNTADGILSAMPSDNTPGTRTSVTKYDVAMRQSVG
jgi:hypothetical protein